MGLSAFITSSIPAEEVSAVLAFTQAEKADATRRAYRSDFEMFSAWCRAQRNVEPLGASPDTVAAYLAAQALAKVKPPATRKLPALPAEYSLSP